VGARDAGRTPWIAAIEGYYGPPLSADDRDDLVRFLATVGYQTYVIAPKDDPFQRANWRAPHPTEDISAITALADTCAAVGMGLGMTISPGLDWRSGDPGDLDALTAKVESLIGLGLSAFGIAWDDVPGGGEALGTDHGAAVNAVVQRVGPDAVRWFTCPVDYAVTNATPYLRAFAAALGDCVEVMWTGPSVVTDRLGADHVRVLAAELGVPLVFGENFPVNDLGMSAVMHLGPYPEREPDAMAQTGGVMVNFMSHPLASRIGLAVAARAWLDPEGNREAAWRESLQLLDGVEPLARACRSWFDRPGPDPELLAWAMSAGPDDRRLHHFLDHGCRDGLDAGLAAEVGQWLDAWQREADVMRLALSILEASHGPAIESTGLLAITWQAARKADIQAFGIRFAVYPAAHREGGRFVGHPEAVVEGDNLTDVVVRRALARGSG